MTDESVHELRGDLRFDDELFEVMTAERAAWEAEPVTGFRTGEAPPKPDWRRPLVCTCGLAFEYESEIERHIERKALEARFPDHFSVGPTGEGPLSAWAFVLTARARGWVVSDPANNGFGSWYATVWDKGPEDGALDRNGLLTPEAATARRAGLMAAGREGRLGRVVL